MRSVVLFVLFFVGVCVAQTPIVAYAGTSAGAATFNAPSWSDTGACAAGTSGAPYVFFNFTIAVTGVYEVAAMAEQAYKGSIQILIYAGTFDPANPCNNVISGYLLQETGLRGGPVVDDYVYLLVGITYQFIVTSSSSSGGLFAVNVFQPIAGGAINSSGANWAYPSIDSYNDCSSDSDEVAPFAWYTWTQQVTQNSDIIVTIANTTIDNQGIYYNAIAALYVGIPNAAGLIDSCNNTATNATFWTANSGEDRGVFLSNVNLTAGWTYTVVFSSEEGYTGYWGVQVIPTRIRFWHPYNQANPPSTALYTQPTRQSDWTQPCSASGNTQAAWDATLFTALYRALLIDTQDPPEPYQYVDTYSFLYAGSNTGVDDTIAPATCPANAPLVIGGDTGDVTPVYTFTVPGVNYTAVVSTYGGAYTWPAPYAYVLYLFSGQPIGSLPPATTGTPTTGAATGSPTATGTPTATGGQTTVSPTPTGGSGTTSPTPTATGSGTGSGTTTGKTPVVATTSSASSVAVGAVAVAAVFASLL